jgi:hypothetical protein
MSFVASMACEIPRVAYMIEYTALYFASLNLTSPHLTPLYSTPLHSALDNQRAAVKYVSLKFENAPSSPHLSSLDPSSTLDPPSTHPSLPAFTSPSRHVSSFKAPGKENYPCYKGKCRLLLQ